jgi:hypothetical protein
VSAADRLDAFDDFSLVCTAAAMFVCPRQYVPWQLLDYLVGVQ